MHVHKTSLRLIAAALGAFVPAGAVFAADLPVKAAPVVPAYYDWSGVYVGVHAGYGGGMKDWFGDFSGDFTARGFLGGGQVGINKQIGSLVFGLELDGSWANIRGSQTLSLGSLPIIGFQFTQTTVSKIDSLVTFAGRAGLAADRWFVYAKGGVTLAHESHALNDNGSFFGGPFGLTAISSSQTGSASEHRVAPMVGVGTEYALGNNWSIKAEYDYIHLGSRTPTLKGTDTTAGVTTPFTNDTPIEQALHVAKVGVNYRFGGIQIDPTFAPVPAAAGYNWSGAYIGAQGAYGFGHKTWPDFVDPTLPGSGKYDVNGWLAGGTGGVNAQAGVFVFGVEAEWMWTGIKGNQTLAQNLAGGIGSERTSLESKIDWLAIASARAGFVVGERLMIYGKAGVAIAEEKHTLNEELTIVGSGTSNLSLNAKAVHTGVVGGVGAEYALGGNWSVKAEYDYIKILAQSFTGTGVELLTTPGFLGASIDLARQFGKMSQDLHLFKFGVNYRFNPAPVVVSARY
jgi:opacity protein-like surface antigen